MHSGVHLSDGSAPLGASCRRRPPDAREAPGSAEGLTSVTGTRRDYPQVSASYGADVEPRTTPSSATTSTVASPAATDVERDVKDW